MVLTAGILVPVNLVGDISMVDAAGNTARRIDVAEVCLVFLGACSERIGGLDLHESIRRLICKHSSGQLFLLLLRLSLLPALRGAASN